MTSKPRSPRILFWDTETRPVRAWVYNTGEQYIRHDQIIDGDHFDIICLAWKWYGEPKIHSINWGLKDQNSEQMVKKFTKIIESADLPIAHNGDRFDVKQFNSQRMIRGLDPVDWPTTQDTLKEFRKYFAFPSYSLDYLAKTLLGEGKAPMNQRDWIDIVQYKKTAALTKMEKYCRRDVGLLEGVYKKAEKYFKPKIHVGLFTHGDKDSCPRCGSLDANSAGIRTTMTARYRKLRCKSCGSTYKSRKKL